MSCIINKTVSNKIMFLSSQYTCTCKLLVFFFFQMKKDYLEEGAMADTADLVVLGAYYGTGNKG